MFQKGLQNNFLKFFTSLNFWIGILVIWISWNYLYSPYLGSLSSSETKLYQRLKKTDDIQSLENLNAETTVKLFLHSIKEEDWNIVSLFYINGDGTINTAFGPEKPSPDKLKGYLKEFKGIKGSFVQEGGKEVNVGYIELGGTYQVVSLIRNGNVWYIDGMLEQ
jgi:hypothetical protein